MVVVGSSLLHNARQGGGGSKQGGQTAATAACSRREACMSSAARCQLLCWSKLIMLALTVLALLQQSVVTAAATQADDAAALLQFATAAGLSAGGIGWSGSQPCAPGFEWSHVICCTDSNAQLRVCELHLSDMDLSGPLPALGANLTELSTLDLSGNSFSGTLPPGLLRPSLTHLNLANNLLSGNWQAGLGQLCTATPNLQVLDLSANTLLAGTLPDCWGQLHSLTELRLSKAALGGTLPASWGNLQLLERLDLSNTRWQPLPAPGQWPLSWANMSSLHYLDLSASNYTTPIIEPLPLDWTFGNTLPLYTGMDLTHLICRSCKWSAAADPNLRWQRNLEWIDISLNNLTAPGNTLPQSWEELPLVTIKARGCNLVEILGTEADSTLFGWSYVPDKLLSTLRILDLGNNWELTESGIDMLFGGMHLWELYIDNTTLGMIGWASQPCIFDYANNPAYDDNVGGTAPVDQSTTGICRTNSTFEYELLDYWNTMAGLGLNWNMAAVTAVAAVCPFGWEGISCDSTTGRVTAIQLAYRTFPCSQALGGCQLVPFMFSAQSGLTALHTLSLAGTSFALDMASMDLSGLFMLRVLDLRNMPHLIGPLSASWPTWMPALEELQLSGVSNGGPLPADWAAAWADSLTTLTLSSCGLTGAIPTPWNKNVLQALDISNNSLSGSIFDLVSNTLWRLDVSSNQLSGDVAALAIAPALSVVKLSNNTNIVGALTGPLDGNSIPSLWNFPLATFEAANCGLYGQLPELLNTSPASTSLQRLDLRGNQLQGPMPPSWATFTQLNCLQLSSNLGLCGNIPDGLPCFDTLGTSLGSAGAGCMAPTHTYPGGLRNVLCRTPQQGCFATTSPASFGSNYNRSSGWTADGRALYAIGRALQLQPGALAYPAPCMPCTFTLGTPMVCFWCERDVTTQQDHIANLDLRQLAATGALPTTGLRLVPEFAGLSKLRGLIAPGMAMQGGLPPQLFNMTQLEVLKLSQANLSGPLPAIQPAPLLRELWLDGNQLTGTLPPNLPNNLELLLLAGNRLSGPVPNFVAGAPAALKKLDLANNQLSGPLPDLGTFAGLMSVSLQGNNMTGGLTLAWANLTGMQAIDLSSNNLTGTLPGEWASMTQLRELRLSSNRFTGTLPLNWLDRSVGAPGPWMQLTHFACAKCGLSGPLPAWGSSSQCLSPDGLQFFDVSFNNLTGPVPASFDSNGNLQVFNVSNNQLSGTFLASALCVGGFMQMQQLRMAHNNFTAIPNAWNTMGALKVLDASYNLLEGAVPDFLSPNLQQLYLDHNNLAGFIPVGFGSRPELRCWSVDYNLLLCGDPPSGVRCFNPTGTNIGLDCTTAQPIQRSGTCNMLPIFNSMLPPSGNYSGNYSSPPYSYSPGPSPPPMSPSSSPPPPSPSPSGYVPPYQQPEPMCDAGRLPEPSAQGTALLAWKSSLSGNPLLSNWGMGDPCVYAWGGVLCENDTVAGLSLQPKAAPGAPVTYSSTYAQGPINWDALTNLTSLRILELQGLYLSTAGSTAYPDIFLRLPRLEVLNISHSRLGGSDLPAAWANISSLRVLDISSTYSWGSPARPIPAAWCGMASLQVLVAQEAGLVGSLDSLPVQGGCMGGLRTLMLGGNRDITGTLPAAWSTLRLNVLSLNQTGVSGSLPPEWGSTLSSNTLGPSLQQLYLHQLQLSGEIPASWVFGLPNVTLFSIWRTNVCGLHPIGGAGLGSLCLDTTGTRLGYNCSANWMGPITTWQNPPGCIQQAAPGSPGVTPALQTPNINDRTELLQVKLAWGNPAFLSSWDRYAAPCGSPGWEWVECGWEGAVSKLNFSGMGLSGYLHAGLMQLNALEVLDLSANSFSGSLPESYSSTGRLRLLDLSRNQLTGTLPASWRGLSALKSLDLSFNLLQGPLPDAWGTCSTTAPCMSQLQNITCRSCGLSGVIPASLLSLQAIQQLVLPHNQLSGGLLGPAVPPSKPPSLRLVDLSYNMLSQVPDFAFWNSSGAGLQRLLLRANAFPSSTPFSAWPLAASNLTSVDLSSNVFAGTLPPSWMTAPSKLEFINLASNMLTGAIPSTELAQPSVLKTLVLSNNSALTGAVLDIKLPSSLQALHIVGTGINGSFDTAWMGRQGASFTCLLAYNTSGLCGQLDASLPCSLTQFTQGTGLNVQCGTGVALAAPSTCKSTSNCPPALTDQQALMGWKASLSGNTSRLASWQGPNPCSASQPWSGVTCSEDGFAVVALNVSGFGLSGPLPPVQDIKQLQVLDVSNNTLIGALPDAWGTAQQLLHVNVSFNNLTGSLPTSWATLANLQTFDASSNKLQGGLPANWGDGSQMMWQDGSILIGPQPFMWRLRTLACNRCGLSGTLPAQWDHMDSLQSVSLANNNLTGLSRFGSGRLRSLVLDGNPLATQIEPMLAAGWPLLRRLSMSRCQLVGTLPPEWSRMVLEQVDLSYNSLQGNIPVSWAQVAGGSLALTLQTLLLNNNQLTGQLPNLSEALALSCWSVASNWGLCGNVPTSQTCGNTNTTKLGMDCTSMATLAPAPACMPPSSACAATLDMAGGGNPSGADMAGLLLLKASVTGPSCAQDPRVCTLFDTWQTNAEPCQVANCTACTLDQPSCGVYQPATASVTCAWRQLECRNGRVSKVLLDYTAVNSSAGGPQLSFGPGLFASLIGVAKLEELHLTGHILNGSWPAVIPMLPLLRVLHLSGPAAPGSVLPTEWSVMSQLESLWLMNMSNVQAGLPPSWSNLTQLQELRITNAPGISGPVPAEWGAGGMNLRWLELSNISLSGVLTPIGGLASLTRLSLTQLPAAVLPTVLLALVPNASLTELVLRNISGWGGLTLDAVGLPASYPNITRLGLTQLGVVGTIPSTWQGLRPQQLTGLYLGFNSLNGTLPSWLASRFAAGFSLDVRQNRLTGTLSPEWGMNGTTPRYLLLNGNNLTGSIPDSWSNLVANAQVVDLSSNRLWGSLGPSWYNTTQNVSNAWTLNATRLSGNPCLCGGAPGWLTPFLDQTAATTNGTVVSTAGTIMQPCGPDTDSLCAHSLWTPAYLQDSQQLLLLKSAAANNQTIWKLDTWRASVPPCTNSSTATSCAVCEDSLPPEMCGGLRPSDGTQLCNWRYVACRDRRVVAINMANKDMMFSSLPPGLSNGTMLEVLDMWGNAVLGGQLPPEYSAWTNMGVFKVTGPVTGTLPLAYSSWNFLRVFELGGTQLTGSIPTVYNTAWLSLENFTLDGAAVGGSVPDAFTWSNLTWYTLQNTPVTSNSTNVFWLLKPQASTLQRLQGLRLGGTSLQLPPWTAFKELLRGHNFTQLRQLGLPRASLSGPIGALSYFLPQLTMLDLSGNQLTGIIPPDLSGYAGLRHLNLADNMLYGTLPPGLLAAFGPGQVFSFDLSNNKLSGGLPDAWGNTTALFDRFNISSNRINGTIPSSWVNLMLNSSAFDVSRLRLSGSLPGVLWGGVNISTYAYRATTGIRITNNPCLCGSVPIPFLDPYLKPGWADLTGLYAACPSAMCANAIDIITPFMHPDWPGLMSLKTAVVGGPLNLTTAINSSWSNATTMSPCHDIDPNCQLCPWALPSLCGTQLPSVVGGPPSFYCNVVAVSCRDGRVTNISLDSSGLVLSSLPAGLSQLPWLQQLGLHGVSVVGGTLPGSWQSLSRLQSLSLSLNGAGPYGPLPAEWSALSALQQLSLSNATVSSGLPTTWASLYGLRQVRLQNVSFTGAAAPGYSLPAGWGVMGSLESFVLANVSGLYGALPSRWVNEWQALRTLHIREAPGITVGSADLAALMSWNRTSGGLQNVTLEGANITGSIPALSNKLIHLSLANNQLQGNLSGTNWASLPALQFLNLSSNLLAGPLPDAWADLRTNFSADVSRNRLIGQLPLSWGIAGTDRLTMQLALLDASSNTLTGTLPPSYAALSNLAPTALLLCNNNLTGGIPAEWATRNSSMWREVRVANNSRMCGQVPLWFYTRFGVDGPAVPLALLNGTRLGSVCRPDAFDTLLDVLNATMPTLNRPLTLVLVSKTSPAALGTSSWLLDVKGPAAATPTSLGVMEYWANSTEADGITTFAWRMVVPGSQLSNVGNHTLTATSSAAGVAIINSPLAVYIHPAATSADASHFSVALSPPAVGATAVVTVQLSDRMGAPLPSAAGAMLIIQGHVTGSTNISGGNLTYVSAGTYSHSHTVKAMERLNFTVRLDGALVGESLTVNITSMLPSAVNVTKSLGRAMIQRDGEATRSLLPTANSPVALPAYSWHRLIVPVYAVGRVGLTYADPRLGAQLTVVVPAAATTANSSNTTTSPAPTEQLTFAGYWSSSNGSYVVPFKLPVLGNATGSFQLLTNASSGFSMGSRSISFTLSQLVASAAASTVSIVPGSPATVGDAQYIVASLLSATKRPVVVADNARATATGSIGGNIALSALYRQTDNTWAVKFTPLREETVTVRLAVDGVLASQATLTVAGRSPTALDLTASMRQATMTSQAAAVTAPIINGTSLVAFTDESSFLSIPIVDKAGSVMASDPGVKAVLSIVAAVNESAVLQLLQLNTSSGSPALQRRRLLQASVDAALGPLRMLLQTNTTTSTNTTSNTTTASTNTTATSSNSTASTTSTSVVAPAPATVWDWVYLADYASEYVPDHGSLDVPPLPPNYTLSSGLGPDLGNAVEARLANSSAVTSFKGVFNSFKGTVDFQLQPTVLDTFLAVITLRHPNVSTSFVMSSFHISVSPNPATAAAAASATTTTNTTTATSAAALAASITLFNPLVNPRLDCSIALPRLALSTYSGGSTKLIADFNSIVASNALLDSAAWVQSSLTNSSPVTINTTAWFPGSYANISSPFESLSALDYFVFLLNQLPTVAFSSTQLPAFIASDAKVSNCSISLPGKAAVNVSAYGAAASTTSTTSGAGTATTGGTTAAISVVNIQSTDLEVVVAAAPTTSNTTTNVTAAVDLTKIVDTTPPVITMLGTAYTTVLQAERYADQGVRVYDNIDGNSITVIARLQLCARPATNLSTIAANDTRTLAGCGAQLAAINTTLPSRSNESFVITYRARDAAGNQAAPLRRYITVTARCASPEKWCPDLLACSVQGLCLKGFTATGSSSSSTTSTSTATSSSVASTTAATPVRTFVPPADTAPPKLVLQGTGRAAVTATGSAVLMANVTWKSVWSDPGATAVDAVDGDLTASIQSFGAGAVDTSVPTPADKDFSYVVEYYVEDKSKNAAPVARRLIRIVCPGAETYCINPETGKPTCTSMGVCAAPALLSVSSSLSAATTATSSATAAAARNNASSLPTPTVPVPPSISLLVPGPVQITAGDVYDRCADSAAITELCERGATADDARDGNLDRQVLVCGNRWRAASKSQRLVPVLLACAINPEQPGEHTITFSVTSSSGLSASVARRLTIKAACPEGEKLCADKVTCSQGGTCVASPAKTSPGSSPSTSQSASATASAAAAAAAASSAIQQPNQPPVITLTEILGSNPVVHVRRGQPYSVCADGVPAAADTPCEPGATAMDPDGLLAAVDSGGNGSTALNLTSRVVVCPPTRCITSGCSPQELQRHYLTSKGLQGCGIDTNAADGTQFKVDFWVWDSGNPILNATISRIVLIDPPCPDSSSPYFCTDEDSGRTFCSGSPCDQSLKLLPPGKPRPELTLLPNSGPAYAAYGRPASNYLGPCVSGTSTSGCGVVAWDVQPSSGKRTDLTAFVKVTQTRDCGDAQVCTLCDLSALASSGSCMPGVYTLTYTVTNDDGRSASVSRMLYVYQAAALQVPLTLYSAVANSSAAAGLVTSLRNASTAGYAAGVADVISKLGSLAAQVEPGDVDLTGAAFAQHSAQNFSVQVNATVYVHVPSGVHRQAIAASSQAAATAAATPSGRHLLNDVTHNANRPLRGSSSPSHTEVAQALESLQRSLLLLDQAVGSAAGCGGGGGGGEDTRAGGSTCSAPQLLAASLLESGAPSVASPPSSSRRLLQAQQQDLADVIAALGSELGTSVSTQPLTAQSVDLLTVYLSALTSSIEVLEQQVDAVNSTTSGLATTISQAFGDNAQQRDSQIDVQLTQLYQGLVSQFATMTTALGAVADTAANKFLQQTAAATSLSAAMKYSITAMREAAALAQQLQAKYVAQTVMLDAATGGLIEDWNCSRSSGWEVSFAVNRSSSTTAAAAATTPSRHLLQSDSGSTGVVAGDQLSLWQGYQLDVAGRARNWAVDETGAPEQARYVGAAPGRNKVVAGLFLHTTRKARTASCTGSSFEAKFDFGCQKSAVPLARNASVVRSYLSSLFAGDDNEVFPYGVDPAFLRSSEALYKPELQGAEGRYYNTSDPTQVPPTTGAPYGFFHRRLQGYASGFPVLLPNRLSQTRSAAVLQYLLDANYLDATNTRQLSAEMMTYNAELQVVGYTRATFDWKADGAIQGFIDVRAVPAIRAASEGGSSQVASWLVPLWLLCVTFIITAAWEAWRHTQHYEGSRHWVVVVASSADCMLGIVTAAVMFSAVVILSVYCTQTALSVNPKPSYAVYDDITLSQAHMLMPAKRSPNISDPAEVSQLLAAAAAAGGSGGVGAVLRDGKLPEHPGDAGRWLLPDADGDWDEWAGLMADVHSMAGLWAAYTLLQGIILVLLIFRLLNAWSFQSKLGIISNTLILAAPQLAHLLFVIVNAIALFALLSYLGLGQRVSYVSSYAASFEETFRALLGLGYVKLPDVMPPEVALSPPQMLLSHIIYYGREVLFVLILMQFFMTTLGAQFMELKARTVGALASSIPEDVARHVVPELRAKAAVALQRAGKLRFLRRQAFSPASVAAATWPTAAAEEDAGGAGAAADAASSHSAGQDQQQPECDQLSTSAESLLSFLKAHYPHFVVSRKTFGDKVPAIKVGSGHLLDLDSLQELFAQLSLQSETSVALLQTPPARAFARQAADAASSSRTRSSEAGRSSTDAAAAVAAAGLPPVGRAAVEAGAPAAAVAAALAAAEQLLCVCGTAVDATELQGCRLRLEQLGQLDVQQLKEQDDDEGGVGGGEAAGLQPGRDYTVEDLQALLQQELLLHRQIYSAIWAAVAAMERWSSGVGRWQAKVIADTNTWLADNVFSCCVGNAHVTSFQPVPEPPVIDLSQSLRPQQQQQQERAAAAAAAVNAAMGEFGAAVVITTAQQQPVRADAGLGGADAMGGSGGSSASTSPQPAAAAAARGTHWADMPLSSGGATSAAAAASSSPQRTSRPSIEVPGSGDAGSASPVPQHQRLHAAGGAGGTSIRSPGGVSLHARTPGAGVRQGAASRLEPSGANSSQAPADAVEEGGVAGSLFSTAPGSTQASLSSSGNGGNMHHAAASLRPRSAGRNQVVPLDASGRFAAQAVAAESSHSSSHNPSDSNLQPQQQQGDRSELLLDAGDGGEGEQQQPAAAAQAEEQGPEADGGEVGGLGRLPTISGKAPATRLQPMG